MIFLYFCKFFVPRSEGPPLTLYRLGDSQDYQSFDFVLQTFGKILLENLKILVINILSSPEHVVHRVSYCDHSPSVGVRRPSVHISLFTL